MVLIGKPLCSNCRAVYSDYFYADQSVKKEYKSGWGMDKCIMIGLSLCLEYST